jgi:hypothetical protein
MDFPLRINSIYANVNVYIVCTYLLSSRRHPLISRMVSGYFPCRCTGIAGPLVRFQSEGIVVIYATAPG